MKAFYYPLLLKRWKIPSILSFYLLTWLLFARITTINSHAQSGGLDLGMPAYSSLSWEEISSFDESGEGSSIGLTKDGRVYTWGTNIGYTIQTEMASTQYTDRYVRQLAPYYVPFPAGETPIKVRTAAIGSNFRNYGFRYATFFCLTASGKMYAWGLNSGIAGSDLPTFPVLNGGVDTTKAKRQPVLMTNIGESSFVDMDFSLMKEYGVIIGSSGKAYHIGNNVGAYPTTFAQLPNPAGVSATFKYTKVWVSNFNTTPIVYLKGNDGNIYFSGAMPGNGTSGVPSVFFGNTPAPSFVGAEAGGAVRSITPRLVPFPAGEDIIKMHVRSENPYDNAYAISASGKAFVSGAWRFTFARGGGVPGGDYRQYVVVPLKTPPAPSEMLAGFSNIGDVDSAYVLKQFTEIAMPPGVTKVIDIIGAFPNQYQNVGTLLVGDNNRVYWSGSGFGVSSTNDIMTGNYLQPTTAPAPARLPDRCFDIIYTRSNSYFSWIYEAVNYRGAAKIFISSLSRQLGIISASGRGYFVGNMSANTAPGKITLGNFRYTSAYPVPIANEQLLSCNTSPGTGGPLGEPVSTPGVGVIDCSKTKLYPAPVQGTPSKLSLLVTIDVATVGDFSPITISGSGMSLVSGFDKVTATTTGVQTFHIPISYDGSTLTNAFQFTIGQAGSCAADLTKESKKAIVDVWTLECVPSVGPMLKK